MASQEIYTGAENAKNAGAQDKVLCGICRRQFSKYNCSTCNVSYCSLTCFRSEAHSGCSETFYRKEVQTGIQTDTSRTAQERLRMMELLKRLEEQSLEEDAGLLDQGDTDDEENVDTDLASRLSGVDVESASPSTLLSLLSESQRARFFHAMDDPSSELAQRLLADTEQQQGVSTQPWWEAPTVNEDENEDEEDSSVGDLAPHFARKPTLMDIPPSMLKTPIAAASPGVGAPTLLYNIAAVCIVYAYTTRHFAASPLSSVCSFSTSGLQQEARSSASPRSLSQAALDTYSDAAAARQMIARLVPFLVERGSRVVLTSIENIVTDVWSRFEPGDIDAQSLAIVLRDAATILRPRKVAIVHPNAERGVLKKVGEEESETEGRMPGAAANVSAHPHRTSVLALSDLASLFAARHLQHDAESSGDAASTGTRNNIAGNDEDNTPNGRTNGEESTAARTQIHSSAHTQGKTQNYITMKLAFYAAHQLRAPSRLLEGLADALAARAQKMEVEAESGLSPSATRAAGFGRQIGEVAIPQRRRNTGVDDADSSVTATGVPWAGVQTKPSIQEIS